jgi:hypothetical protein
MRFTKHFTAATLLLTALVAVGSAVAQEPPAPPSKPAAENDGLKMFVKPPPRSRMNWAASGSMSTSSRRPRITPWPSPP